MYNTTTYNGFLYLLAMKAGGELARMAGDTATAAATDAAFARGQAAMDTLLWNGTLSYLRAYTGGNAVMSDALYGQLIALHHGLGFFYDESKLAAHLAAELKYNGNPYGLTTVTGRHTPPPKTQPSTKRAAAVAAALRARGAPDTEDDTIWLQSAPTWSTMMLRLQVAAQGAPLAPAVVAAALEPAQRQLVNQRTRLSDLWNWAGLNSGGDWGNDWENGMPWVTSHYGFGYVRV